MYSINEENLKGLAQIYNMLEQIDLKGYQNIGLMFQSLTMLRKIVNETENSLLNIEKIQKEE